MKPSLRHAAFTLALAAASAVTATPRPTPDAANRDYIRGRYADADNRLDDAARYYNQALRAAPGDAMLQRRGFDTALAAGDQPLATALAGQLEAAKAGDAATAMVQLADAVTRRDWTAAAAVRGLPDSGYAVVVPPIVGAWIAVGRGDRNAADALDPGKYSGVARSYITEHRALLLLASRRYAEADALFATLLAGEAKDVIRLRLSAAASLAAQRETAAAAAMLRDGGAEPSLTAAAARLAAGKPVIQPAESRTGIAWLMVRLAADLSREKPLPLAVDFARIATFLAPDSGETWLVAGDVLLRSARPAAALVAYDRVPAHDWVAATASAHRAAALAELGRDAEARTLIEAATRAPNAAAEDWQRLGDLERKLGHHAAAADAFDHAIALAGSDAGWLLYFLRGSAYEQGGDWSRAEPDLRRALRLAPGEPMILNYLGYALLDRGLKLDEATALVATASKLRPDDGFIADSLGWAYFRTGDFAQAVPALEAAARQEPGDATINEHLGDAYWQTGRQLEARFRWRAALDLAPEAAAAALLARKIDFGLDVALAQAPAAR